MGPAQMNWKATTVATGATTLAGWLMNSWLYTSVPTDARPEPRATRELSDIIREAERLHRGVAATAPFEQPRRNPFRFGARPAAAPPAADVETIAAPEPLPVQLPPAITLAAIAIDPVDGGTERTAVLTTPTGIVFAKEGQVVGDYRVEAIDDDGVDLVSVGDGGVKRLVVR
jgi:hypothetical protein